MTVSIAHPSLHRPGHAAVTALVWLAVLLLPVTGIGGIGALGELKGSASVHILLLTIPIALAVTPLADFAIPRPLFVFVTLLLAWIAVTTAVNFETIANAVHHARSGLNKLVASSVVLGFGVMVAAVSLTAFRSAEDVERLFVRPLALAVVACVVFALPEIWSWLSPLGETVYQWTTGLLHAPNERYWRSPGRLISLAFEAPDLSYFCGFALPWMLLAYRLWSRGRPSLPERTLAVAPLILGLATLMLSNSRTGIVMLAGLIMAEAAYWIALRRLRLSPLLLAAAATIVVGLAVAWWLATGFGKAPADTEDISTMSRLALLFAQLSIFAQNPVFGVGFGQFGFHADNVLAPWAWESFEIVQWFETTGDLPPSFNVAGRISAELGLPGLAIWYGFWIWAMWRIANAAPHRQSGSVALYLDAALLANATCLMLGGISNDAFRRPETWIVIAITALHAGRSEVRA